MHDFQVPIHITQPHDAEMLPGEDRVLRYKLEEIANSQGVTRGRFRGVPDVRLGDYRCKAVFDWVEIAVTLPRPMLTLNVGRAVRAELSDPGLGGAWVGKISGNPLETTDQVLIRLQDPSLDRFEKIFSVLSRKYSVDRDRNGVVHRVVGFELSIDFYPRESKAESGEDLILRRIRMSELLRKHFVPHKIFVDGGFSDPDNLLRYVACICGAKARCLCKCNVVKQIRPIRGLAPKPYRNISKLLFAATDLERHEQAPINGTVYVGARNLDLHYRLQDKTGDQRTKHDFRELAPIERRSRIEFALMSGDMEAETNPEQFGIYRVQDIELSRMEALREGLLNFQYPTFGLDEHGAPCPDEVEVFRRTGAFGLNLRHRGQSEIDGAEEHLRRGGTQVRKMGPRARSVTYTQLNQKVWKALKRVGGNFVNT